MQLQFLCGRFRFIDPIAGVHDGFQADGSGKDRPEQVEESAGQKRAADHEGNNTDREGAAVNRYPLCSRYIHEI